LTYNRAAELDQTLARLAALPERPATIVIDNASTDNTAEVVARYPGVRHVRLDRNLACGGRNVGARLCEQPYVAFCDDDTAWGPGSLSRAAELFERQPRLAVVTARVLVGPDERVDPTCLGMAGSPLARPDGLPGPVLVSFLAGASVVRRSAFLEAGGFETRFHIGGEEELLGLDLLSRGWWMAYVDGLIVHHWPSPNRDLPLRRWTQVRNALWVAWLRRPPCVALARTVSLARSALGDGVDRRALLEAFRGLPWALRRRRQIPSWLEQQLRQLAAFERQPFERQPFDARGGTNPAPLSSGPALCVERQRVH
jgi:GT2 family glycosyltransferase